MMNFSLIMNCSFPEHFVNHMIQAWDATFPSTLGSIEAVKYFVKTQDFLLSYRQVVFVTFLN